MVRKRFLTLISEKRRRRIKWLSRNPTRSRVVVKKEPVNNIIEGSGNTDEELESPVFVKVEVECGMEESCQEGDESWNKEASWESNASLEEEEELMTPESAFFGPGVNDEESKVKKVKEEPIDNVEESPANSDEELQYPATVFVKTEPVCDVEDSFDVEEAFQDGDEEMLEPSESEFLEPVVNDKDDFRAKKDSLAPISESGFLASIRQKIGALFPGKGIQNKSPKKEGPYADFVCTCNERFTTEEAAMAHANTHDGAKPFRCLICKKHFSNKGDALLDMKSHIVNKYVRKHHSKQNNLYAHLYLQTDGKPVQCYICNKNFTKKEELIAHMRTHTGGKPFQCDVCTKFFWQKCHLFAHMRIHTGEKPFQCNICSKNFRQKANLVKHMNVHTDRKTRRGKHYQCKVCKQRFTQSGLKDHRLTHSGNCLQDEVSE